MKPTSGSAPDEAIITMPDGSILLGTTHSTSAPKPPSSGEGSLPILQCYKCRLKMSYPAGIPAVKCPQCGAINGTQTSTPITFTCPFCRTAQQIPNRAPVAICFQCRNNVTLTYRQPF